MAAAKRLLVVSGFDLKGVKPEEMLAELRGRFAANQELVDLLDSALAAKETAQGNSAELENFGEALKAWIDRAEEITELKIQPLAALGVPA